MAVVCVVKSQHWSFVALIREACNGQQVAYVRVELYSGTRNSPSYLIGVSDRAIQSISISDQKDADENKYAIGRSEL